MRKYLIDGNGPKLYFYNDLESKYTNLFLASEEIMEQLNEWNEASSFKVVSETPPITFVVGEDIEIVIHNEKELYNFIEKYNLEKEAKKYAYQNRETGELENYRPNWRVNRGKIRPSKMIASFALTGAIIFSCSSAAQYEKKEDKTSEYKPSGIEQQIKRDKILSDLVAPLEINKAKPEIDDKTTDYMAVLEKSSSIEKSPVVDFSFDPKPNDKFESTISFCGDLINYYADRAGLPFEAVCAQITQERPSIVNGKCDNICQIESRWFVGEEKNVPVYGDNGFTGNYDKYVVTSDMLGNLDGNIKTGVGYIRNLVDEYDSLLIGMLAYNQGSYAMQKACQAMGINIGEFIGHDEKALELQSIVAEYYSSRGQKHGDPNYLGNVFRYADFDENGELVLNYFVNNVAKTVTIRNKKLKLADSDKNLVEMNGEIGYNTTLGGGRNV